jgi:hypothetical protein
MGSGRPEEGGVARGDDQSLTAEQVLQVAIEDQVELEIVVVMELPHGRRPAPMHPQRRGELRQARRARPIRHGDSLTT